MEKVFKVCRIVGGEEEIQEDVHISDLGDVRNGKDFLQSYGNMDINGKRIYELDYVEFDVGLIDVEDTFWNSNAGEAIIKMGLDGFVLEFRRMDEKHVYGIYYKKDGRLLTEREEWELRVGAENEQKGDHLYVSWSSIGDLNFVRYLEKKNAFKVIGSQKETSLEELFGKVQ